MLNSPIFEAAKTISTKDAVNLLRQSLLDFRALALVFPASSRKTAASKAEKFPYSLASVIYAIYHKNTDRAFFDSIARSTAGAIIDDPNDDSKSRYAFNPKTGRVELDANSRQEGTRRKLDQLRVATQDQLHTEKRLDTNTIRAVVGGYLNNPDEFKEAVDDFSVALYTVADKASPTNKEGMEYNDYIDALVEIEKKYRSMYINALTFGDKKGNLEPKDIENITDNEARAFMACRMSEDFGEEIRQAFDSGNTKQALTDTVGYVTEWLDEGGIVAQAERYTGDNATNYVAIDVNEEDSLTGAKIAPEYIYPMFAVDCSVFDNDKITDSLRVNGYVWIAGAFGLKLDTSKINGDIKAFCDDAADKINSYVAKLATNPKQAEKVRDNAIQALKAKSAKIDDVELRRFIDSRILRLVFLVVGGDDHKKYPVVSGTGDEKRMAKTAVVKGNIQSRTMRMLNARHGADKVISDAWEREIGNKEDNDEFSFTIGDTKYTMSRGDETAMHDFELPYLVKFLDQENSFPTYCIWRGITVYDKMVDANTMAHHRFQDPNLVDIREKEGPELVKRMAKSISGLDTVSALGAADNVMSQVPALDNTQLYDIGKQLNELISKKSIDFANPRVNSLPPATLQSYELQTAISGYQGNLASYLSANLSDSLGRNIPSKSILPFKQAVSEVLSRPSVMMSTTMTKEEIIDAIGKTANEYYNAAAHVAGNVTDYREAAKAYLDEFFKSIDSVTALQGIATEYDGEKRTAVLKQMVKDFASSVANVVEGYGFNGIGVSSLYNGGKYDSANRFHVTNGDTNAPMSDSVTDPRITKVRSEIIDGVINPVKTLISTSVSNPITEDAISGAVEMGLIDASVKNKIVDTGKEAFGEMTPSDAELINLYAILAASITGASRGGKMVNWLNRTIKDGDYSNLYAEAIKKIGKTAAFNSLMSLRNIIATLSDNGNFLSGIEAVAHTGDSEFTPEASNVALHIPDLVYGNLAKAFSDARRHASEAAGMADNIIADSSVHIDPHGKGKEYEFVDDTALGDVAAPEEELLVSDKVEKIKDGDWHVPTGLDMYYGLTGMLGFDTVKIGTGMVVGMADTLSDIETVTKGIGPNDLIKCARLVDTANSYNKEKMDIGEKGAQALAKDNISAWANKVIGIIGDYMTSYLQPAFSETTGNPGADHELQPEFIKEWSNLYQLTTSAVKEECTDNTESNIAPFRMEILEMLNDLAVDNTTLEGISMASTAFAHVILKLGELSDLKTSIGDPMGGTLAISATTPELGELAVSRASEKSDSDSRVKLTDEQKQAAGELLKRAADSIKGNQGLIQALSNTYYWLGRNETEGSDSALDTISAMKKAAGNKVGRAKTEIAVGKAPTGSAGGYKAVFDSEDNNDASYSEVAKLVVSQNPESFGQFIHENGIGGVIENGPLAGVPYVSAVFGEAVNLANNMSEDRVKVWLSKQGARLAIAFRMQMVDNLLSDKTFNNIRDTEAWPRITNIFFGAAQKILGTDGFVPASVIFASLDPTGLNIAHETRVGDIAKKMNAAASVGAAADKEQWISDVIGKKESSDVTYSKLTSAVNDYLAGATQEQKDRGLANLNKMIGPSAVKEFFADVNVDGLSVNATNRKVREIAAQLNTKYGKSILERLKMNVKTDQAVDNTVNTLYTALSDVFTGKNKDAGFDKIIGILGPTVGRRFIDAFGERLNKAKIGDNPAKLDSMIHQYLDEHLHSNASNARSRIIAYASGISNSNILGSSAERIMNARELGGFYGKSHDRGAQENDAMYTKVQNFVEDTLANMDVTMPADEQRTMFRKLQQVGFKGSIEEFCDEVAKNGANQDELAHEFATNDMNYDKDLHSALKGPLGALTPSKTVMNDEDVVYIARRMEKLGLTGIRMEHDSDDNELPMVRFANSPRAKTLKTGAAKWQMEILVDEYNKQIAAYNKTHGTDMKPFGAFGEIDDAELKLLDKLVKSSSADDNQTDSIEGRMSTANVHTPVDQMASTKEIYPVVTAILAKTIDDSASGRAWVKIGGGVTGDHILTRERTIKGNKFLFEFDESKIAKQVNALLGGSEFNRSEIIKAVRDYRMNKLDSMDNVLTKLVKEIKSGIDAVLEKMANEMVKKGSDNMTYSGINGKWLNKPATPPPPPPPPPAPKPNP